MGWLQASLHLQHLMWGYRLMEQPLLQTLLGFMAEGQHSGGSCTSNKVFQPGINTSHFCLQFIRQNKSYSHPTTRGLGVYNSSLGSQDKELQLQDAEINGFSSVQLLSRVWLCDPMNRSTPGLPVHHLLPEFTQIHVHWVSDAIQPSHPLSSPSPPAPIPSQHQSLFHLFTWGGQSTAVSALASLLPKKSKGWSPSEWTGWISLQSKELSRVFSNTSVQMHQFFSTQFSSLSNSHIHTWPLEKP